ncbi:MAG: hypothetical protein E7324_05920 [Clostridiales bacterium]|nr:hypothetical protein [Clostridiales bacterium]
MEYADRGYLVVTDYVAADGKTDVSAGLQQLIDDNPNRTLFFPDGVYLLSRPILTPAHPEKSVDLQLSNFARLLASPDWDSNEAMVRLGAKESANNIYIPGSNYSFTGGIVDGAGRAKGISIDGGRETCIRNVSIKNVTMGIHIKYGANSGSSDADITGVNITGTGTKESVGVLLEGYDNTLTNMRIAKVFTGVEVRSGGNMLRNIHPLFILGTPGYADYEGSVGFRICHGLNWFDYCYSDQYAVGFDTDGGGILKNCFCWWYSGKEKRHIALHSREPFYGSIDQLVIGGQHHPDSPNRFMEEEAVSESGSVRNITYVHQDGKTNLEYAVQPER